MVWGDKDYLIAPSILSADFARLGEEVDNVLEAHALQPNDHVPDNECDNLDTNRLKNELELELEASLLETFKKYKIFYKNST